ncbi:MAG: nickel pincer cofactor biosynthesis protein LarC [Cyanobacteria bacterium J06621_11]
MKKLAYLECPTGIAGDMCLGALVHAGVPLSYLIEQLAKLGIQNEFTLRSESVQRNQQSATKVHVDLHSHKHDPTGHSHIGHSHDDHSHAGHSHTEHNPADHIHHTHSHSRKLPEIEQLIEQANLPKKATQWSLAVFRQLAKAEAAVHGIPPKQVHFHEVGATDAIVDIVGTCLGLDWLKIDTLVCSPLPTGGGTVRCDHGLLPVPAPAVLNMMMSAQVPVYSNGIEKELVTPTGCAIATTLAQSFGPPPRFTLQKIGLGAGGRDLALPNILRLWIGTDGTHSHVHQHKTHSHSQSHSHSHSHKEHNHKTHGHKTHGHTEPLEAQEHIETKPPKTETVIELQTQIDDCSPQAIGYLFEQLFAAGALDVFSQAVSMKKNRLGTLLTIICPESVVPACEALLFRETTTLGIRQTQQTRSALAREMIKVSTPYGEIAVKVARAVAGTPILNMQPEYEDCAKLARTQKIPWKQVHQAAMRAAMTAAMTTTTHT